jgi:hypothetical protein
MIENRTIHNKLEENAFMVEIANSNKEKLSIAETVLKTLGIRYQIKAAKTHNPRLKNSLCRKTLGEINDELITLELCGDVNSHGSN